MRFRRFWKRIEAIFRSLTILDYILAVIGISGLSLSSFYPDWSPIVQVSISIILVSLLMLTQIYRHGHGKVHTLDPNSEEEADFFCEWYSQEGELRIFTRDLEWLETSMYAQVVHALNEKAKRDDLSIYIEKPKHPIVAQLIKSGAKVFVFKNGLQSEHRFSIRNAYGIKSVIIRNKDHEPTKIRFEEYPNDSALYNLAYDMLSDCCTAYNITSNQN